MQPLQRRWLAVIISVAIWAVVSVFFELAPRLFDLPQDVIQKVSGVSPIHCLILGVMSIAVILPPMIEMLTKQRLFHFYFAMWCGAVIPAFLFGFRFAAGFGSKCDRVIVACGIFAFVAICAHWLWETSKKHRSDARSPSAQVPLRRELTGTSP